MWLPLLRLFTLIALLTSLTVATADEIVVTVKETALRRDKQFFAPAIKVVKFTEKLELIESSAGWLHVRHQNDQGWIHSSAASAPKEGSLLDAITLGDKKGGGFSEDEVALAGKGFNAEVEKTYRSKTPKANFNAVDALEKVHTNPADVAKFAAAGELIPRPLP
ncbi:MAG: hypothetical protein HQL49_13240 [Gammaproteobacteria bacterium]|nr:hypothetical protein [Gammaproteobacteria bacterium]